MNHSIDKININDISTLIEPVFYYGLNKSTRVPECLDPKHAYNSFEYMLKQNPKDLSCHLQRIHFSLSLKSNDKVFAAISDLFIILGEQGLPLRQRLFNSCKKLLDKKQIEILGNYLTANVLTRELVFLPDNCFFKKRPLELIQLRDRSMPDAQEHEDVLLTADSYIENSQFEIALEYMISHLEQDPENEDLTIKLIKLYKALGYIDEFQNAYYKFADNLITSRFWDDAKQYFLK